MDVGLELRQARERSGVTLQQLSHSTKISLRVLQAIEAADETRLPAPVFTRSFIRTYAKEIGLDPEDTTRRYLEQLVPPDAPEATVPTPEPASATSRDLLQSVAAVVTRGRLTTPVVLAVVVIAIIALSIRNYSAVHARATAPPTPAVGTAGSTSPQTAPPSVAGTVGSTPATPAAAALPAPPDHLHLTIVPTGLCWVRATVDGKPVVAALLKAGERSEVDAPSDITLRIGEPGTFAFTINGSPARLPARAGQPATVHLTKENYRTFLTDGR
jgi:cytoskeleton protein RodZ